MKLCSLDVLNGMIESGLGLTRKNLDKLYRLSMRRCTLDQLLILTIDLRRSLLLLCTHLCSQLDCLFFSCSQLSISPWCIGSISIWFWEFIKHLWNMIISLSASLWDSWDGLSTSISSSGSTWSLVMESCQATTRTITSATLTIFLRSSSAISFSRAKDIRACTQSFSSCPRFSWL